MQITGAAFLHEGDVMIVDPNQKPSLFSLQNIQRADVAAELVNSDTPIPDGTEQSKFIFHG